MKMKFYALTLAAICVVTFILQLLIPGFTEMFLLNENSFAQPWRFLTSIFLHADIGHIAYNMFALVLFGTILERFIGDKRFLIVYFGTGIVANLISINFYNSSLGASGAIFGVIGALVMVRPLMTVWAFGLPMPLFVAGILWGIGDLIGAYGFVTGNPLNNTGNIAHLAGLFFGLIIGAFFRDWSKGEKNERSGVNQKEYEEWEDRYMRN